ncbi:transmembrane protease serine 2-like [Leuresthes tenuis]|uniref:transmembrane protease serine 2-like n=1 Tax=Leuresthes tenuis TaxID=355514 RepID=UPI003B500D30
MVKQKMAANPYLDSSLHFIQDDTRKLPSLSRSDVKPQYVHHLAQNSPPEISPSVPPKKGFKQRCVKFTVVAVISLLLLLLLAGILLGYYYSSPCVHGMKCGDGSCVWESQWCNGVKDCPEGQDEANCVRLHGSSFLLQIYWTPTKDWRTVCSHGWSDQRGRASCQDMGYSRGTYFKSGKQRTDSNGGFLLVKSGSNPQASIVQQLVTSNSCPSNSLVTLSCTDCGSGVNSSRASGRRLAPLGSWPWQVSLQVDGSHRCGGAIISPYWIITAAHCVARTSSPGDWSVYAGILGPLDTLFNPACSVSRIIAHEGYDSLTRQNDIALMRLSKALDFTASSKIGPACLPNPGLNVTVPENYWITQFGPATNEDSRSLHLMEAQVTLVDSTECSGRISEDMLCARRTDAGARTCHSDGGGPLVSLTDGLWWLIGDSIWAEHCTGQNKPGVYGNITQYLDWIYSQMKKHQDA